VAGLGRLAALLGILFAFTFGCLGGAVLLSKASHIQLATFMGLVSFPIALMTAGLALYQALKPLKVPPEIPHP
jgi:hypothetical protein